MVGSCGVSLGPFEVLVLARFGRGRVPGGAGDGSNSTPLDAVGKDEGVK